MCSLGPLLVVRFVFTKTTPLNMQGSYHGGNTASRPISEVKHRWALLVLTWETSLEPNVTLRFFPFSLALFFSCTQQSGGVCNSVVVRSHSFAHKCKIMSGCISAFTCTQQSNVTLRFFSFSLAPFLCTKQSRGSVQFFSRPLSFFWSQVQDLNSS